MTEDKKQVVFLRTWRFAHGGHTVVTYAKDSDAMLSGECLRQALNEGAAALKKTEKSVKNSEKAADLAEKAQKKAGIIDRFLR